MRRFALATTFLLLVIYSTSMGAPLPKENKSPEQKVNALIDQFADVTEQDAAHFGTFLDGTFPPFNYHRGLLFILGRDEPAMLPAMMALVKHGPRSVPFLVQHLDDARPTQITLTPGFGGFHLRLRTGAFKRSRMKEYTVKVGDLCLVTLGHIVNRPYTPVRHQGKSDPILTPITEMKRLREELTREWGKLTAESFRVSLLRDLDSDQDDIRQGAAVRLVYYFPTDHEAAVLKQLARPTYSYSGAYDFIYGNLYPAKNARERKELLDAYVAREGVQYRAGVRWLLYRDLKEQEDDEAKRLSKRLPNPPRARQCLIDVFDAPANVKSSDRPNAQPLDDLAQAELIQTLLYDRSERLDRYVLELLTKTDDEYLPLYCLDRLVGRGYDAEIDAYLKRELPRRDGLRLEHLQEYEARLGWTRLHAAAYLGVAEMVRFELGENVPVNAKGRDGRTALHVAAEQGYPELVAVLLAAKADPNLKDVAGHTALDLAKERGNKLVIALLDK